jgi:hypothetical protein
VHKVSKFNQKLIEYRIQMYHNQSLRLVNTRSHLFIMISVR